MNKKVWLGLLAVAGVGTSALPADADISRDSIGSYQYTRTTVSTEGGQALAVYGDDPTILDLRHYVDATGRYGGGDTDYGRMTAKRRANAKVVRCATTFFTYGLFETNSGGSIWSQACGVAPTDRDIRLISNATAYFAFEDLTREKWCGIARNVANQRGITGPVYLSGDVKIRADAAGTEADELRFLGSFSRVACY